MKHAIYVSSGQIIQTATGPLESIEDIIQDGQYLLSVEEYVDGRSHYIQDGGVVAFPTKPSAAHRWDWVSKTWQDTRSLGELKTAKMVSLKQARDAFLAGGFTWDGSVFDSDTVSQTRLMGLKIKAQDTPDLLEYWRLQNNSWRALSAADANGVWDALGDHVRTGFTTFQLLESQVSAATQASELGSISWP